MFYQRLIRLPCLILLFFSQSSFAINDSNGFMPPTTPPVKVGVGLLINNISNIFDPSSDISLIMTLHMRWYDPRLKFSSSVGKTQKIYANGAAENILNKIWFPDLDVLRRENETQLYHTMLTINSNGEVNYIRKTGLKLDLDLDVHRFPFDKQQLNILITPFAYSNAEIEFYKLPEFEGIMPNISIPNWELDTHYHSKISTIYSKATNSYHSLYQFTLNLNRQSFQYAVQVLMPLFIISFMCYFMLLTPIRPGDNFQVLITIVLAMIAFQWLILNVVPSGSYINFTEALIFISFSFCCAVMISLSGLEIHEKLHGKALREKTEKWLRLLLFLAYVAANLIAVILFFILYK